ncbi:MAG TPA: RHS repeat-associated core domain-containing protein, partial [Terriglobales bacterium]|nr:RHS repeat-associated core domain-containing protein [Terriglobales bacterium]
QATGNATINDSNGNVITVTTNSGTTTFTDTLGTTALTASGTPPGNVTYCYPSPTNPSQQTCFTVTYSQYTVQTHFLCSGINEYSSPSPVSFITGITLPGGGSYSIGYEQTPGFGSGYVTGRINSISIPTGAAITYTYTGGNNGVECADGSTAGITRQINNNGSVATWTYTRSGSTPNWTTTVTDPQTNQTQINFKTDTNNLNYYETSRTVTDHTLGLLKTIVTCYNSCNNNALTLPVTDLYTYTEFPNTSGRTSLVHTALDPTYGRVTETDEYDFGSKGSGTQGALLRKTTMQYASLGAIADHPSQVTVYDGNAHVKAQTTYSYDQWGPATTTGTPQHISVSGPRGMLTTLQRWTQGSNWITDQFYYFDTGMLDWRWDPNGSQEYYTYGDCGNSFLTNDSRYGGLHTSAHWDCNGGLLLWTKDENSRQTTYTYGDANYWRATEIDYPDGGQTTFTYYTAAPVPWAVVTTQKIDSGGRTLSTTTQYDGLGRSMLQFSTDPDASGGNDYVGIGYDSLGRVSAVSNPYATTSDPTYGTTVYSYDSLDRITKITRPDNNTVLYSYSGAAVSTQDEGNGNIRVQRISQVDGLGRITSVCELSSNTLVGSNGSPGACGQDIAATGFLTLYTYDSPVNTMQIAQPGLNNRSITYDGLSRVVSETNPESGTTTYFYDTGSPGDLYQRVRPSPNQNAGYTLTTTYSYDQLHRLTQIQYSDNNPSPPYTTPGTTFQYDQTSIWGVTPQNPLGRLTHTYRGSGNSCAGNVLSYDAMGRVVNEWQQTPTQCGGNTTWPVSYSYDYLGNLLSWSNGMGPTLNNTYNTAGRLLTVSSSLSDSSHPNPLLTGASDHPSGVKYNPLAQVVSAKFGDGMSDTLSYDSRGRLSSVLNGNLVYSLGLTYNPNSTVKVSNESYNKKWTYSYDEFNRLQTASKTGQGFSYDYDRYGNRWHQNVTAGSGYNILYSFDANNHITPDNYVTYDAAGNVISDGSNNYTYDAEGMVISANNGNGRYFYDAFNRRVQRIYGSTYDYAYDQQGRVIGVSSGGSMYRGELYAGAWHIGTYFGTGTYFNQLDWLGTERVRADWTGAVYESCQNTPFGDGQTCTGGESSLIHFAGMESDPETNDGDSSVSHTWNRQYSPTEGRWLTADPAAQAVANPGNPQSWNQYSYVMNNPTTFIDPLGLDGSQPSIWINAFCQADPIFCAATPAEAYQLCVFIGLCGDNSSGNTGSGGNGTGSAGPTPSAASNSKPPLSGETNGIPNGFRIPRQNIWNVLLPGSMQCDFGVCVPIGNGVLGGTLSSTFSLDPGFLMSLRLLSNLIAPFKQVTTQQCSCADMRSSLTHCGYTCTCAGGEEWPSAVWDKLFIRIGCGKWACPIGLDSTLSTTHWVLPGVVDMRIRSMQINRGTCVYPGDVH